MNAVIDSEDEVTSLRGHVLLQDSIISSLHKEKADLEKRISQLHEICAFNAETIRDMQRARS